jgi:hypothetical protein
LGNHTSTARQAATRHPIAHPSSRIAFDALLSASAVTDSVPGAFAESPGLLVDETDLLDPDGAPLSPCAFDR